MQLQEKCNSDLCIYFTHFKFQKRKEQAVLEFLKWKLNEMTDSYISLSPNIESVREKQEEKVTKSEIKQGQQQQIVKREILTRASLALRGSFTKPMKLYLNASEKPQLQWFSTFLSLQHNNLEKMFAGTLKRKNNDKCLKWEIFTYFLGFVNICHHT